MCSKHSKKKMGHQLKMKGHFKNFHPVLTFAPQRLFSKKQNGILKLMLVEFEAGTISKVINN